MIQADEKRWSERNRNFANAKQKAVDRTDSLKRSYLGERAKRMETLERETRANAVVETTTITYEILCETCISQLLETSTNIHFT